MTTQSEQIKDRCSKVLRAARSLPYGNTCNLAIDWGYDTVPHTPKKDSQDVEEAEKKEKQPMNFNPVERTRDAGLQFVLPPHPDVLQSPTQPPNFYPGNRFIVSAILANTLEPPAKVVLKGTLPGGEPVELPVNVVYVLGDQKRLPLLHILAAKRFIRELEDGDSSALGLTGEEDRASLVSIRKNAIVEYGLRYSLASKFTAFIAVEKSEGGDGEDKMVDKGDEEAVEPLEIDDDGKQTATALSNLHNRCIVR